MKGIVGVTDNDWSRNGRRRRAQGVRKLKATNSNWANSNRELPHEYVIREYTMPRISQSPAVKGSEEPDSIFRILIPSHGSPPLQKMNMQSIRMRPARSMAGMPFSTFWILNFPRHPFLISGLREGRSGMGWINLKLGKYSLPISSQGFFRQMGLSAISFQPVSIPHVILSANKYILAN